jgi:hypothetical protein
LSVSVLPKFVPRPNNSINLNEYYGWRNLREAIDSSIKREPGYLCYEIDGRKYEQPVGILNMVMRFKSTPLSDPDMKNAFKWTEFKWNN